MKAIVIAFKINLFIACKCTADAHKRMLPEKIGANESGIVTQAINHQFIDDT